MAQKNITGDLNVTGTYKQNGTALASGTKLYRHVVKLSSTDSNFNAVNDIIFVSNCPTAFTLDNVYALPGEITIDGVEYFALLVSDPTLQYNHIPYYFTKGLIATIEDRRWVISSHGGYHITLTDAYYVNLSTGYIQTPASSDINVSLVSDTVTPL